MIMLENRWD